MRQSGMSRPTVLDVHAREIPYDSGHRGQRFDSTDSPLGEKERKQIDLATRTRREKGKDPNKWTNDECANGEVDRLAGQAWGEEFSNVQNQANVIRFRHAGDIQVITSTESIAGRISKRLLGLLTTERGMTVLQKATQMTDKAMKLLDNEATLQGAKHFGVTMYSVSHWVKCYTPHWYMASRKYKFGLAESAECKCCRDGVEETTAHIFQCPNRNKVQINVNMLTTLTY